MFRFPVFPIIPLQLVRERLRERRRQQPDQQNQEAVVQPHNPLHNQAQNPQDPDGIQDQQDNEAQPNFLPPQ